MVMSNMINQKRLGLFTLLALIAALALVACQPQTVTETVEVTRIVTETITEEGAEIEVTRLVEEVVEVTAAPVEEPAGPKDMVICQAQEPDTMYIYGGSMLAARAVQHAVYTNNFTTLSYSYQAEGIEKLPSLDDGDAVLNSVEVAEGDMVRTADDLVKALEVGDMVQTVDGETVEFDGTPVMLDQMVVDFTMLPRVWSDGTPVTAADSVYGYNLQLDPDTPVQKYVAERTASYEATGDLSTRWTSMPGYRDSTFFLNFFQPFPEHLWGELSAAELLESEISSRMPVGDGAFKIDEWVAGDSIRLSPNEFYYRADEGLPYLDSITFRFIPDTNQLLAQLLSGQCDIATQDGMSSDQAPFLIEAEAGGLLVPYFQTGTTYEHIDFNIDPIDPNARHDWFEDVRVRQAMTQCTDRQGMVDNILFGRSEVIHTYVPTVHPLYPTDGITEWAFDPEAGAALLEEAGFVDSDGDSIREDPNGQPFAPELGTTAGNAMRQQLTQIFKENMLTCGIDVQLTYLPAAEWFADGPDGVLFGRQIDLGEFAWLTGVEPSCDLYLSSLVPGPEGETNPKTGLTYSGWGGQNQTGYYNPDFDVACQQAIGNLPGTAEYTEGHLEAQRIFSQDVPVIPLFLRLKVGATRPEVLNYSIDSTQNSELYNIYEFDLQQ